MRNVYLVVTDLHASYKNKDSRYDYLNEIDYVIDNLVRIIDSYKDSKVHLIFLGDIADNSFKNQSKAIYFNNLFVYFKKKVESINAVVGNHEMSYYVDNPFWSLFNSIKSERIQKVMHRSWQPTGLLQLVEVLDVLEDGEVNFCFNHHATDIVRPKAGKINIGLFHKDIVCKAIIEDMKINNELDIFETNPVYIEKNNILTGYNYCFFGHAHKVYGNWNYEDDVTHEKIKLYYLASLGRPNHTEVNDKFLERNIPAIIVNDGKLETIEHNKFNLISRGESVKEEVVRLKQKIYHERKAIGYFKEYRHTSDNPIENIKSLLSMEPKALNLFEEYENRSTASYENELKRKLEGIKWL